jgi:DNA mismatch repair protein MutL
VNIHPQKLDVKFLNPGMVFDALPKLVRAVLQTQLVPVAISDSAYNDSVSYGGSPLPSSKMGAFAGYGSFVPNLDGEAKRSEAGGIFGGSMLKSTEVLYAPELFMEKKSLVPLEYFQVLDTYLVLRVSDGLWILDQHAVHERILYEKIKDAFGQNADRQVLLVSEVIALPADLFAICLEELPVLDSLGFGIEEFGANQVVIREIPSAFMSVSLTAWLIDYLEQAKEVPGSRRELTLDQKERLQMKACKAAIKAGQRMHEPEVRRLLSDLRDSPSNYTCPHGRPLFIVLDKNKLENLFLR